MTGNGPFNKPDTGIAHVICPSVPPKPHVAKKNMSHPKHLPDQMAKCIICVKMFLGHISG